MPRFVVQQHFRDECDWHFDIMFEAGEALATFSSGVPPDRTAELPCLVEQLPHHRPAYLEYEGEISGGRGWCRIYDRGTLDWLAPQGGADLQFASEIRVRLDGEKAKGVFSLAREALAGADYWRLKRVTE